MAKAKKEVAPTYGSVFRAIQETASTKSFGPGFTATQITLTGDCECQPLYIKIEDKVPEVAPYEYHNADFYIDCDPAVMADILNGKKTIYDAVDNGSVTINGNAAKAVVFIHNFWG